jgi:hypothetical protein
MDCWFTVSENVRVTEQCENTKFCVLFNKTHSDTLRILEETFDKVTMMKMRVFKWYINIFVVAMYHWSVLQTTINVQKEAFIIFFTKI